MSTMNTIHSPLEALAFNYATFGFTTLVNNLWTCLALLTAALSLWKIRTKPHLPPPPSPPLSGDRSSDESPSTVEDVVVGEDEDVSSGKSSPAAGGFCSGDGEVDGVTKGKFTLYYEEERECELDGELTVTEVGFDGVLGCETEWWEKWGEMLKLRMGEKGWYMFQDLTDLNGNVVRLWDYSAGINGDMRFAKEVMCSSSCIVW